ncbi:TPA: hypothetical protein ACTPQ1_004503 [Salmonella enterica]
MYILNNELTEYASKNPIMVSFLIVMAANKQDPNNFTISDFEEIIANAKESTQLTKKPTREEFPLDEAGEIMYNDMIASYHVNKRGMEIEYDALSTNSFAEMIRDYRRQVVIDDVVKKFMAQISPFSLEFENRAIALATHRLRLEKELH